MSTENTVRYESEAGIAIATIDRPPVNAIDESVRAGLMQCVERASGDPGVKVLLIKGAGRSFSAGAELRELESGIRAPSYADSFGAIENSSKPVIAVLSGSTFGGGVELALACHYRCATPDARLGMPEITLGIVPGAGATQRLPRLVGARRALEILVEGTPLSAKDAKAIGLVDEILDDASPEAAKKFARGVIDRNAPVRATAGNKVDLQGFGDDEVAKYLGSKAKVLAGRTTQFELVKAISAATRPFAEGLAAEKAISDASLQSQESKALRYLFFAERTAAQIPGAATPLAKAATPTNVAVIGAGTMGSGIAMAFANAGIAVTLVDAKPEALERGLTSIRATYEGAQKRGRLTAEEAQKRAGLISPGADISAAARAELAIEAVFENLELKQSVMAQLGRVTGPDTILASNTSTLSVTKLGEASGRPAKTVGMHFFSPANVMPLVEIVRGGKTAPETLRFALDTAQKIRKIGVVAGDKFGFIGNRMMLDGYFREGEQLLLEGASVPQLDRVMESFGFAMGPNRVNDMAGIDIGFLCRQELARQETRPDPYHAVADALYQAGRLGQKSGLGFYRYEPGVRDPIEDPGVAGLIETLAANRNIARRAISDEEVRERCILQLVNVGAQILEEGVAYRASDIDVVWVAGYGFPRARGGPMFYADTLKLENVLARIVHYQSRLPDYWRPAPLLMELVRSGRSFADFDGANASKAAARA